MTNTESREYNHPPLRLVRTRDNRPVRRYKAAWRTVQRWRFERKMKRLRRKVKIRVFSKIPL